MGDCGKESRRLGQNEISDWDEGTGRECEGNGKKEDGYWGLV